LVALIERGWMADAGSGRAMSKQARPVLDYVDEFTSRQVTLDK